MVRRKCPSAIETKSYQIHRFIQVAWQAEWRLWQEIFSYKHRWSTSYFHHLSDFCDRLDEYGTGASKDLCNSESADSIDPVDDTDHVQEVLDRIHKDLMFENDEEELCVEVHIDQTGKESHNIIECWKQTLWETRHCHVTVVKQFIMCKNPSE